MARRKGKAGRNIATYEHPDKERVNNPPVGLVTPETDRDAGEKTYAHDPHLDPHLAWSGKAEHTSFEVPTVSLHVHERIDPRTIIEAVRVRKRRDTEAQRPLCSTFVGRGQLRFKRYLDDFGYQALSNWWGDIGGAANRIYVVQTNTEIVKRCILMTTQPGDLVLDPTCGGGTTAYVAEEWGRRWITCDSSRVSLTLAKQRIMSALFEYFQLARSNEGVGGGFSYETAPHITSTDIANDQPPAVEILYDQPLVDRSKARVTGPFTVEAVPAPTVLPLDEVAEREPLPADGSVARTGPTIRQGDWRDELLKTGNTKTGNLESGNDDRIALWMLDPDYDGRSLFPHQVFFPMAGAKDGWAKLAKSLKAEIDATRMAAYRGTVSLPFKPGEHGRAAVKIVDDRGVESLKIVELA